MKRNSIQFAGLIITAGALALFVLIGGNLITHYPEFNVARTMAMGWPLILIDAIVAAVGLRVAFWRPQVKTRAVQHTETRFPTRAAA